MFDFLRCIMFINKEIKFYILGFLFSLVLTAIPFISVIKHLFSSNINYCIILICAITQIVVHFFYFLHLNFSVEQRWNMIIFIFILIIIFIIVFGSIWIMYNLNHHMIMK